MQNKRIPGVGAPDTFYDGKQLRMLMLQFMAIFTDMAVQTGAYRDRGPGLIPVPIWYGQPDRVVAALKAGNTTTRPISVPCMTARISDIQIVPNLNSGLNQVTREVRTPLGGVAPNDTIAIYELNPYVYQLRFELSVFTSNTDQQTQILEQILLIFGVPLQFQTNDTTTRSSITSCTLTDIRYDDTYPLGLDPSHHFVTLSFECPAYIAAPVDVRKNIIQKIMLRIGAVSHEAFESGNFIEELDNAGIKYDVIADITEESI